MSVLIKGMKIPPSCHECVAGYGGVCFVAPAEADGACPDHDRPDWCPLIPIPPHGRLIDADAPIRLEIKIDGGMNMCVTDIYAPTVIEAEGGDA